MWLLKTLFFFAISAFVFSLQAQQESTKQNTAKNWQQWKLEYDQTIIGKAGWLSLAGLYWLENGENTLGSDLSNMHQFPENAPAFVGSINISNQKINFSAINPYVKINQQNIKQSDLSIVDRTTVTVADYEFYLIKREGKVALRLIDNASTNLKKFDGTKFIPFNEDWMINAKLVTDLVPQKINIATVYGTNRVDESAGWLEFEIDGKQQRLQAVSYGKDYPMNLIFSDASSGQTTYAAGRYIDVQWPDQNGNTQIDFNRAYNPPCTYTNFATCPLTPRQNRMEVSVDAGELDNDFLKSISKD